MEAGVSDISLGSVQGGEQPCLLEAHVLWTCRMDLWTPGQSWGLLASPLGGTIWELFLLACVEMLISPGWICQASLKKYKCFLKVLGIYFLSSPTHCCPQWQDCSLDLKAGEQGCWCSCQCSLLLLPAQGFVCQSSFDEENTTYSCTAHRKAHGAGAGSGPHFCQIQLLARVKLHSLASEQCNFFRLKSFYCSAVVDYYN